MISTELKPLDHVFSLDLLLSVDGGAENRPSNFDLFILSIRIFSNS